MWPLHFKDMMYCINTNSNYSDTMFKLHVSIPSHSCILCDTVLLLNNRRVVSLFRVTLIRKSELPCITKIHFYDM